MAASTYEICALADVKDFLNIASADTEADTPLQDYLNAASQRIIDYTGRYFKQMDVDDEYHDHKGGRLIHVRKLPIYAIGLAADSTDALKLAKLVHRASPDDSYAAIEDDIDHIFVDAAKPFIEFYDATIYTGPRSVRLDYQVGLGTIPELPVQVCLEMVQEMWEYSRRSKVGRLGVSTQTHHGATTTYLEGNERWERMLKPYRIIDLAVGYD